MCRVTTSSEAAVVTRYSDPATTRILAGFRKFSASDANANALFCLDAKVAPCIQSEARAFLRIQICTDVQGLSIDNA